MEGVPDSNFCTLDNPNAPLNPCPVVPCPGVTSTLYEGGRPGKTGLQCTPYRWVHHNSRARADNFANSSHILPLARTRGFLKCP